MTAGTEKTRYSIILPVRNGGHYVKECVNSILSQSQPYFNLHILDSFSTDDTLEWARGLQDPRVEIHSAGKPLTIGENWARILTLPKNEFITIIGHDDLLHPHYLQEMDALIARHPRATLYQSHFRYIDQDGRFIRNCLPMDEMQYAHEFLACHMMRIMDSMGTGYMMRSADYDAVGGIPVHYPNLIFADYELWINLMRRGYKATTIRECFSYRIHQNLSKTTNGMLYQQAFLKYLDFIEKLMHDDNEVREVVNRYGKDMLMYYCESLSHRLLKTPVKQRSLKVSGFIEACESYAAKLIPGQDFQPMKKFRISIASRIDRSLISRGMFKLYKKLAH